MNSTIPSSLSLIPHDPNQGGSRFGWHFISLYKECPMKWFNRYMRPRVAGGAGCEPIERSANLDVGSVTHAGLEAWYLSGWQDGNYSLEAAMNAIVSYANRNGAPVADAAISQALQLMETYHGYCGPGGTSPEYPTYKVASRVIEGALVPLVEHTFEVPLGYKDYLFTAKTDLVVEAHGMLFPWDHKTCAVQSLAATRRQYRIDGQVTGQLWVLRQLWPDANVADAGLINFVIKGGKRGSAPRDIFPSSRTPLDFEVFRATTVRTLARIESALEEWQSLRDKGMDDNAAALLVFDSYPSGRTCGGSFFACDYYDGCVTREMMEQTLNATTAPRWTPQITALESASE